MKKIIYMLILICSCLACTDCSKKDKDDHVICRLYIFPTSRFYPLYYIEITDSQTVRTISGKQSFKLKLGDMLGDNERFYPYRDSIIADRTQYPEYEIDEKGRKLWHVERFSHKEHKISDMDYRSLNDEIERVRYMEEINEFAGTWFEDAAGCILLIDDRQYIMLYSRNADKMGEFGTLIKQILKLSPIDIDIKNVLYGIRPVIPNEEQ